MEVFQLGYKDTLLIHDCTLNYLLSKTLVLVKCYKSHAEQISRQNTTDNPCLEGWDMQKVQERGICLIRGGLHFAVFITNVADAQAWAAEEQSFRKICTRNYTVKEKVAWGTEKHAAAFIDK